MKKIISSLLLLALFTQMHAQTNPIITNWLINTTNLKGRHYVAGNSTPINDNVLANVQSVQYSTNWVYVDATGIPAYITGPFQDGNPSFATEQTGYFKLTLNPTKNTGTPTATNAGNIGVFINGVALFDYRDGVAWNQTTMNICGGPGNPPCPGGMGTPQAWNRDAIPAERAGFDCAKAHPAMGNYHHHQSPSAFNLDQLVISNVCDLYPADGLYVIDSTKHSPLLGFAYDGFPIYGAYAFKNLDGTGGIVRMKSGYQLKTQTTRVNGPTVGQVVGTQTFFNGYFREDYEFVANPASDFLDEHNGRVCVTPEYPNGIYCYFATVNENWNSAYPYAVGPTFYGVKNGSKVTTISEPVTTYNPSSAVYSLNNDTKLSIFPNPASDFIAVQASGLLTETLEIRLNDLTGKLIQTSEIQAGSTISYFDCRTLYTGVYLVSVLQNGRIMATEKVVIKKD
ncbi:MAG: YHYH protein [Saprospiraceae bacterium]